VNTAGHAAKLVLRLDGYDFDAGALERILDLLDKR
jgi:hypothetical protein